MRQGIREATKGKWKNFQEYTKLISFLVQFDIPYYGKSRLKMQFQVQKLII